MAMGNRKVFFWVWTIGMVIILLSAPGAAAEQRQAQERANTRQHADRKPIICPRDAKTGETSFDAFQQNLLQCKMPLTRRWWNAWQFWKKDKPAVKVRNIQKGSIASAPFFSIHQQDSVVQ